MLKKTIILLFVIVFAIPLNGTFFDNRPDFSIFAENENRTALSDITTMTDLIIGPDADTLLIDSDYSQFGNLIVIGDGTVIIDDAELSLYGSLWQQDNGTVIVRNSGYLHVMQAFLSQYPQYMCGNSRFVASDATVYANTTYRTFLHDNSVYIASRTHFPFWNFRECYDNSTLILEDANMVGDMLVEDSCYISLTRCDTILPWFGAGDGAIIDFTFPGYDTIDHFEFDSAQPGVSGVKYRAVFDSCATFYPGICPAAGCSVIIRNSVLCAALRVSGADTLYFTGVSNKKFYPNYTMPFFDRHFQLLNSYTQLWCIYTYDDVLLHMDSCYWGESHAKDNSIICAVNCSTNGFPSSVTSTENGYFSFIDGKITAFVSSWFNATTYIENSIVTPIRPGIAQRSNIAHHHSRLLCVNSVFDSLPFAMDTSLVIFAFIDSLDTVATGSEIPITGSAWVDIGPESGDNFANYTIYYYGAGPIIEIASSFDEVSDDTLAIWNTEGLDGAWQIRLVIRTAGGESLLAEREVFVAPMKIAETSTPQHFEISAYPNPFNSTCRIEIESGEWRVENVEIFDINGRMVEPVTELVEVPGGNKLPSTSSGSALHEFTWRPAPSLGSGVYLIRARFDGLSDRGTQSTSKRIVYLK